MLNRVVFTLAALAALAAAARPQCVEVKLQESASNAEDRFGLQVLAHEDVLFVAEAGPDGAGSVHVFSEQPQGWVEFTSFLPSTTWPDLHFGAALAADGDFLLVGSRDQAADGSMGPGGAWMFIRDRNGTATPLDDEWLEWQALVIADPYTTLRYGWGVALTGGTALVGAPYLAEAPQKAAAYVFVLDDKGTADPQDDEWVQQARLDPAPATATSRLGTGVALMDGGWLALASDPRDDEGVEGGVLQFLRDSQGTADPLDDTWLPAEQIEAPPSGFDRLVGGTVVVAGERLFASGVYADPPQSVVIERVYVFERGGGSWSLEQAIDSPQPDFGPFGLSMAADGERLVSGNHQWAFGFFAGAYSVVYERIAGTWTHVLTLQAPDESLQDNCGRGVSLVGQRLYLGTPGGQSADDIPAVEGAVYVLDLVEPNGWTKLSEGGPPDPVLAGWGCLDGGSPVTVRAYDSSYVDLPALLLIGTSLLDQPLFGEQLIPTPDILVPIVLGSNGDAALTARWPAGVPAGLSAWFQVWMATGSSSDPWSVSNGLRVTQPAD